jgi:hypothetical protein
MYKRVRSSVGTRLRNISYQVDPKPKKKSDLPIYNIREKVKKMIEGRL